MKKIARFFGLGLLCIATVATCEDGESLNVSVQQGKLGAGGSAQEYRVMNGETFFIPVGDAGVQPPGPVQPPTAQDLRAEQLAKQIQAKITQLQKKKNELDNELYIVHRAPLELDRQELERQLTLLEQEQEQFDAQKTINETQQKRIGVAQASAAPRSVQGVTVKPILLENNEVQLQVNSNQNQMSIKTTLGTWAQIPGVQPETWVRVNLQ